MSKLFEKFSTDGVELEKVFRKYPTWSALYVSKFFSENVVSKDAVMFKGNDQMSVHQIFMEDDFTDLLLKKMTAKLPASVTAAGAT